MATTSVSKKLQRGDPLLTVIDIPYEKLFATEMNHYMSHDEVVSQFKSDVLAFVIAVVLIILVYMLFKYTKE